MAFCIELPLDILVTDKHNRGIHVNPCLTLMQTVRLNLIEAEAPFAAICTSKVINIR
jgi:hypothetical protein